MLSFTGWDSEVALCAFLRDWLGVYTGMLLYYYVYDIDFTIARMITANAMDWYAGTVYDDILADGRKTNDGRNMYSLGDMYYQEDEREWLVNAPYSGFVRPRIF